jgi:hypothetical protein
MNELRQKALEVALSYLGTKEVGANRGPEVEKFLASVGLGPGAAWCAAFCYFCVQEATLRLQGVINPLPRTGGVLKMWQRTPWWLTTKTPVEGAIFIQDRGGGKGHTGFVVAVDFDSVATVEGNTNRKGSREGDGVYRQRRKLDSIIGFIDVSASVPILRGPQVVG